jgi:rod shape-determining protein MreD
MVDPLFLNRLMRWSIFVIFAIGFYLLDAMPLGDGIYEWPAPSWVLLLAFAWVLRRPEYLPIGMFAVIALTLDLLQMRPPGLVAGLSVLAVEFLRSRSHASREWPFLLEWLVVAIVLLAMVLMNRVVQGVFAVPQARFGMEMQQFLSNVVMYPVIVGISGWVARVRRPRPGEGASTA